MEGKALLSEAHATMALGWMGAHLATRVDRDTGTLELPEPPEWLAIWGQAVEATREEAEREELERLRNHRELARSVADVTDGDREPTGLERVEIEAIAQAHYEAYQRLAGKTSDWREELPESVRGLMKATIADLIRASVIVPGPTTSAGYLELYLVCTNRPGPGAATLIREALDPLIEAANKGDRHEEADALATAREEACEAVDGACEFVDLEDADGRSYGPNIRVDWGEHPRAEDLARLGPFRPFDLASEHRAIEGRRQEATITLDDLTHRISAGAGIGAIEARNVLNVLEEAGILPSWKTARVQVGGGEMAAAGD